MFENKTFSFVKHFKLFLIISAILVVTGVAGLVTLPFGVNLFNMDVDFLGGVTMTYDLGQQADTAEVENIAKGVLEGKLSSVTTSGSTGTQVVVKALMCPMRPVTPSMMPLRRSIRMLLWCPAPLFPLLSAPICGTPP